ncbi:MAG: Catechol 1,2-dioxygenase, partial [uncultured Actinomycetospora sp.]
DQHPGPVRLPHIPVGRRHRRRARHRDRPLRCVEPARPRRRRGRPAARGHRRRRRARGPAFRDPRAAGDLRGVRRVQAVADRGVRHRRVAAVPRRLPRVRGREGRRGHPAGLGRHDPGPVLARRAGPPRLAGHPADARRRARHPDDPGRPGHRHRRHAAGRGHRRHLAHRRRRLVLRVRRGAAGREPARRGPLRRPGPLRDPHPQARALHDPARRADRADDPGRRVEPVASRPPPPARRRARAPHADLAAVLHRRPLPRQRRRLGRQAGADARPAAHRERGRGPRRPRLRAGAGDV